MNPQSLKGNGFLEAKLHVSFGSVCFPQIGLSKCVLGLFFLPAQFTMQAMGKARVGIKKGLPPKYERSPVVSG